MEDLFNMLSSSARLDKSKRKKPNKPIRRVPGVLGAGGVPVGKKIKVGVSGVPLAQTDHRHDDDDSDDDDDVNNEGRAPDRVKEDEDSDAESDGSDIDTDDKIDNKQQQQQQPQKKKDKKQHSQAKLSQIHKEEIAAFRRRMGIRLSNDNKHDESIPDPIWSFKGWKCPVWWGGKPASADSSSATNGNNANKNSNNPALQTYHRIHQTILANIENGSWVEPTPIQMQSLPSLMERRDVMGCAPTGSGKTGAFVLPALMLAKCPENVYYGHTEATTANGKNGSNTNNNSSNNKNKKKQQQKQNNNNQPNLQGHVRTILLAPSRELASQLHREVLRLSANMPNKFHSVLLSKSNAGLATSNQLGGKSGLDVLVSTPLRLVECLERGMRLSGVRLIVLDEADRLLDASDGAGGNGSGQKKNQAKDEDSDSEEDSDSSEEEEGSDSDEEHKPKGTKTKQPTASGTSQSRTFLQQIDSILTTIPSSATRALFSATLGPSVRHLSESILRSPIDITTGIHAAIGGNSAAGGVASETIQQELKFVGREEGKLLAIRQMVQEGITPPVLIFLQSKERAQALFGELLYDGIRVDVIHAGRSPSAREASVAKFRKGETWVLICTDLVARGVDFKAVNLVINYDLPLDGVTYVHRIGRTGRAGREGRAITFFTEADFENLRTIANVMRLSGCEVPEWMLTMKNRVGMGSSSGGGGGGKSGGKKRKRKSLTAPKRSDIDTTPLYDKKKKQRKKQLIKNSKQKKGKTEKDE